MFSRRHPYLFFILCFLSIISAAILGISIFFALVVKSSDFAGLESVTGDKVGILEVNGVIIESKQTIESLKHLREDDSIKAIVLRINSPGGGVGASQEIYREIRKTRKAKKIIASLGGVAASGGYYIAAATNGIVANPGTITGSIGVILGYTNFKELLSKIGMSPVVIKSGKYKDIGSSTRDMRGDEKEILQNLAAKIHTQFIADVAKGRKMEKSSVEEVADGRIFTGEDARGLGLVDRLGNLEDAVQWAGRMGGIKGKVRSVYAPKKRNSIFEYMVESTIDSLIKRAIKPDLYTGYIWHNE